MSLRLDFVGHDAAKYAVTRWHYSRSLPAAPVKIGVWEDDTFVGVVLFARGSNRHIGKPYDLEQTEVCELARVALSGRHATGSGRAPTSQIVSQAVKMLKKANPGMRLIVSYADSNQGHVGTIYQAMNWIYVGEVQSGTAQIRLADNVVLHKRTAASRFGTVGAESLRGTWYQPPAKFKYLLPLDRKMRKQIEPLALPYPRKEDIEHAAG